MNCDRKRAYRQIARAASAQDTGEAILRSFRARLQRQWYDEISLDDVAEDAGTTRQTVIRRFGGKAGLLAAFTRGIANEIEAQRPADPTDDIAAAVAVLVAEYEINGDMVLRFLALEGRIPELDPVLAAGRSSHRRWVETSFAPLLVAFDATERAERLSHLLVATDVWTWFLLRRTQGRSVAETQESMTAMISRLLQ